MTSAGISAGAFLLACIVELTVSFLSVPFQACFAATLLNIAFNTVVFCSSGQPALIASLFGRRNSWSCAFFRYSPPFTRIPSPEFTSFYFFLFNTIFLVRTSTSPIAAIYNARQWRGSLERRRPSFILRRRSHFEWRSVCPIALAFIFFTPRSIGSSFSLLFSDPYFVLTSTSVELRCAGVSSATTKRSQLKVRVARSSFF